MYCLSSSSGFYGVSISRNRVEDSLEVVAREFPFERLGDRFVALLEVHDAALQRREIGTFIRHQDLPLQNGKVNLDLVDPTRMDRRVNQNRVRIPAPQAIHRRRPAMGRT